MPVSLDELDAAARGMPEVSAMSNIRQSLAPSFSPDGESIAFVSDRSGVPQAWIAGADGGTPRALTSFEDPITWAQWSPDGAWIAVSVAPGGGMNTQIWLVHPDGSGAKRITAGGKDNNFFNGFSHDGKKLLYASNVRDPKTTDLYLYDVASGAAARVADAQGLGSLVDVSRDGKRVLLLRKRTRGNADLYVVDVGSGAEIHVTPHEGPAGIPSGCRSSAASPGVAYRWSTCCSRTRGTGGRSPGTRPGLSSRW